MMSNKWTFSLTSLITILALAFVVSPAMAQFGVKMTLFEDDDVSSADGAQADPAKDVMVRVTFDKIVKIGAAASMDFNADDIMVFAQDMYGRPVTAKAPKDLKDFPPGDGTNYQFTLPAPEAKTAKVVLYINKEVVELADPRAERADDGTRKAAGKNKAAALEITYLAADAGAPRVYSIVRASPNRRLPILEETADSFQVVITLSEKPKKDGFKKDKINVSSNATASDPIALTPTRASTFADFGKAVEGAPKALSLYSTTNPAVPGLHEIINDSTHNGTTFTLDSDIPATLTVSKDLQDTVSAYLVAFNTYGKAAFSANSDEGVPSTAFGQAASSATANLADSHRDADAAADVTASGLGETMAVDVKALKESLPRMLPDKKLKLDLRLGGAANARTATEVDISQDPVRPDPAVIRDDTVFGILLEDYTTKKLARDAYKAADALNKAYDAVLAQVAKEHNKAAQDYIDELTSDKLREVLSQHMPATGTDGMLHPYVVTITPKFTNKDPVVIKVKAFEDQSIPPEEYKPPVVDRAYTEGFDKLTVKVGRASPPALAAGTPVNLTNKRVIPKGGFLVVATDPALTGIHLPKDADADNNSPKVNERTPAELKYNVIKVALPDLETFLSNGGTIDLVAPDAGIYISEIMWGRDASLATNSHSQWIEIINNSGKELKTGDKTYKLMFYGPNETLPDMSVAANNIQDRVGTIDDNRVYWSVVGKGQGGRSGHGETKADLTAVVPTLELISMYRTDGSEPGNVADSWLQSPKPAVNIDGANRIGSPGDAVPAAFAQPPKADPPAPKVPGAVVGDILITEIMVDTGNDRLPQWIEIANFSGKEVNLDGWSLEIKNNADDADVATRVSINLTGLTLDVREGDSGTRGEAYLIVAWGSRSSSKLSDRVLNASQQLKKTGRYTLLSPMGFIIELLPPQTTGVVDFSDEAGNLGAKEAWDIPMSENGRSSLIRVFDAGVAGKGMDANGWILAEGTNLLKTTASWYGSDEDAGTPGVIGGGPLPVELSQFRPTRDKATGQVMITWSTQSELNNAGFYIKRAQQRDGEFKVINATMVPGAGTTSEKQFYTYTDTTAQPNVVYYYQIEDVSLDGQRQTLTRGIRLKGHIGAAGKLTSTWGELKSSNE